MELVEARIPFPGSSDKAGLGMLGLESQLKEAMGLDGSHTLPGVSDLPQGVCWLLVKTRSWDTPLASSVPKVL